MTIIGTAYIEVKPDSAHFGPITEKGVLSSVTSIARKAATIFGAIFVGREVLQFAQSAFAQAEEALKIGAQTDAVIKSTGGSAGVTAVQVGALADALSRKIGVDDEAIQSSENLLLTFTNVKNQVGSGNDIFDQAVVAIQDMAAAMGTDAQGATLQLGKALNDPIAGITALTRVGVTFSAEQKAVIKSLVDTGDVAGAQKVILAELAKEFGGSAEAQATAADRAKVAWENFQETFGNLILPVVEKVAGFLADNLPAAAKFATDAIASVASVVGPFFKTLFSGQTEDEGTPIERFALRLRDTFLPILTTIKDSVGAFFTTLRTGFTEDEGTPVEKFALLVRDVLWPALKNVTSFIADHMTLVLQGLVVAFALFAGPITGTIVGLTYLYVRFQSVRDVVAGVISAVQGMVSFFREEVLPVIQVVVGYITEQFGHLVAAVQERWGAISEAIGHVLTVIKVLVAVALAPIILAWRLFHDQIMAIVMVVWDQIRSTIEIAIRIVRDVIDVVLSLINGDWGQAWDAIKDLLGAVWDFMVGLVRNSLAVLHEVVEIALGALAALWGLVWDGIKAGLSLAWEGIKSVVGAGVSWVVDLITGAWGSLSSIVSGIFWGIANAVMGALEAAVNGLIGLINIAIRAYNSIPLAPNVSEIGEVDLPSFGNPYTSDVTGNAPVQWVAAGGVVRARNGGVLLGMAEAGLDEAVLPLPGRLMEGLQALAHRALTNDNVVQLDDRQFRLLLDALARRIIADRPPTRIVPAQNDGWGLQRDLRVRALGAGV